MKSKFKVLAALGCFFVAAGSAQAGIVTFTDIDAFRAAAGELVEIDFETLPDGSPSVGDTPITPEFNYTDLGVTFSSPFPALNVDLWGDVEFALQAAHSDSSARNWIVADFATPTSGVGFVFPGVTTVAIYGAQDQLLTMSEGGSSGSGSFLGFISDVPIEQAVIDGGGSFQTLQALVFRPIPEPTVLILLALGSSVTFQKRVEKLAQ